MILEKVKLLYNLSCFNLGGPLGFGVEVLHPWKGIYIK